MNIKKTLKDAGEKLVRKAIDKCSDWLFKFTNKMLQNKIKRNYLQSMIEDAQKDSKRLLTDQPEELSPTSKTPIDYIKVKRELIAYNILVDNTIKSLYVSGKSPHDIQKYFNEISKLDVQKYLEKITADEKA
jgi:hypothetical protein